MIVFKFFNTSKQILSNQILYIFLLFFQLFFFGLRIRFCMNFSRDHRGLPQQVHGMDLTLIAQWLGHKPPESTLIYAYEGCFKSGECRIIIQLSV